MSFDLSPTFPEGHLHLIIATRSRSCLWRKGDLIVTRYGWSLSWYHRRPGALGCWHFQNAMLFSKFGLVTSHSVCRLTDRGWRFAWYEIGQLAPLPDGHPRVNYSTSNAWQSERDRITRRRIYVASLSTSNVVHMWFCRPPERFQQTRDIEKMLVLRWPNV